jgi:hypothetical protein
MCEMAPYDPYDTHMCEMAPPPYDPVYVPVPQPVPQPFTDDVKAAIAATINGQVLSQLWSAFQERNLANVDVPVGLTINADGTVQECSVAPVVDESLRTELCSMIGAMYFPDGGGRAGQVDVRWDGTVPETTNTLDYTHMCEMAPPPYEGPRPPEGQKRSR